MSDFEGFKEDGVSGVGTSETSRDLSWVAWGEEEVGIEKEEEEEEEDEVVEGEEDGVEVEDVKTRASGSARREFRPSCSVWND